MAQTQAAARRGSADREARPEKLQPVSTGRSPGAFSQEEELEAYRSMLLIRRFEEKAGQLYGMGRSAGSAISTSARKPSWWACRWR
jgi:pyruvate dehydrogenase E1 component alpha subunit